jgi:3-oxoacyl-[acyl-carrier-protein] synthase-3
MRGGVITGWGTALPDKVLTNYDLESMMDTSHDWIVERTGIHERRIGGTTAGLSIQSGRAAIERAGLRPEDIDLVILATTTPDQTVPGTAPVVQHALGTRGGAVDLNAACSGWVYALVAAHGYLAMGAERVLVIGTETLSRITDYTDRGTGILFADGSAAAVVEAVDGPGQLLGWNLGSKGQFAGILYADVGSTLVMDGKEVFRQAVRVMVESAQASIAQAGVSIDDIAVVIPHQANIRIIASACEKLGLPVERTCNVLETTGNTSAATIPLALAKAVDTGRLQPGQLALLVGFGAGMTSASAVLRWGGDPSDVRHRSGGAV